MAWAIQKSIVGETYDHAERGPEERDQGTKDTNDVAVPLGLDSFEETGAISTKVADGRERHIYDQRG